MFSTLFYGFTVNVEVDNFNRVESIHNHIYKWYAIMNVRNIN